MNYLVDQEHPYRRLDAIIDFQHLSKPIHNLYSEKGRKEKGVEIVLRNLVLQFIEDFSDLEMERFLQENNSGKRLASYL